MLRLPLVALAASILIACGGGSSPGGDGLTVAMMPKNKGNPYFVSCRQGADEAAQALGIRLLWDGPTDTDPAKQNDVVEAWITRGVDVLAVSVENKQAISTVLRKARGKGIKVITWDADAEPDARDFFVNQATPRGIAETLVDHAARLLGGTGRVRHHHRIAHRGESERVDQAHSRGARREAPGRSRSPTSARATMTGKRAFDETQTLLRVHPGVKVVMAIASPAVPGAAEAVKQSGRTDVKVTGLGLPNASQPYLEDGVLDSAVLWNTRDLGYLTIQVAHALANGTLKPGATSFAAGRLGEPRDPRRQRPARRPFHLHEATTSGNSISEVAATLVGPRPPPAAFAAALQSALLCSRPGRAGWQRGGCMHEMLTAPLLKAQPRADTGARLDGRRARPAQFYEAKSHASSALPVRCPVVFTFVGLAAVAAGPQADILPTSASARPRAASRWRAHAPRQRPLRTPRLWPTRMRSSRPSSRSSSPTA